MNIAAVILLASVATTGVMGQGFAVPAAPIRSASGQFAVFTQPAPVLRPPSPALTNAAWLDLDPTLVVISAERIRQAVWRELGYSGVWQGRISIVIRPARGGDEMTDILSDRSAGGWNYRVTLPDRMVGERYLRTLVQVVLLELANRSAPERAAEVPVWLTEGLTYHLLANNRAELILAKPQLNANGVTYSPPIVTDVRRLSALEKAHKVLLGETPMTFEELSWPAPGQTEGADGPRFRACAQLFTHELLNLRGGRDCMRAFIAALPAHLNWQMAFLKGFQPHFKRPLDIEKWWALQSTGFAERDLIQTWTYEESWNKLAAALIEPVDVYGATNELPMRAEVKLQAVVRDWEAAKQNEVLRRKLADFEALRLRLAPEFAGLAADYSLAIGSYLKVLGQPAAGGKANRAPSRSAQRAQRDLLRQLELLEVRVEKFRPRSAARVNPPVTGVN